MAIYTRVLSDEERRVIDSLSRSRTAAARQVERATIIRLSSERVRIPAIAARMRLHPQTVRDWVKRFNASGLAGLEDRARSGKPPTYTAEERSEVVAAALRDPQALGQPFASWTLDRLQVYLCAEKGIGLKRSRIGEILLAEGLRWRQQETWFSERACLEPEPAKAAPLDEEFAQKRGPSRRSTPAPRPQAS